MDGDTPALAPPGSERPRRFRPRLRYELIGCGLHGHELLGTDAAALRPADAVFAREAGGLRWYRCLRCDSWLPLAPPASPAREHPPERDEVALPLRGRPLRDRFVLRLIAIDRAFHFVLLGLLGIAILVIAAHESSLRASFYRVLADLQGSFGGPVHDTKKGFAHEVERLLALRPSQLHLAGAAVLAYAVLEGVEAIGLWFAKRWAEYLTFVATTVLLPLELYELTTRITALKVIALIVNVAIVIYLLRAKRLFGVRGGGAAEHAAYARDTGWQALERSFSEPGTPVPAQAGS
jgi:uncharacterized membrane protein (DUF2068 family)